MGRIWGVCAIGLLVSAVASAQQTAILDYFAVGGKCETDYNRDGIEDFLIYSAFPGSVASDVRFSQDMQTKFGGVASQRLQLQKSGADPARYMVFVHVYFDAHLKPEVGEPLLVRFAIRAENLRNAQYSAYVATGSRRVDLFRGRTTSTNGWEQQSIVLPVERDANGTPHFRFNVEIEAGAGAANATLWVDEIQAISARTVLRNNQLPNGMKLCLNYLYLNGDGFRYLNDLPIGVIVGTTRSERVISHHYPNVLRAVYAYFSGTMYPVGYRHNADLYNYDDVIQNHPDWFLLDRNGQRIPLDETFYLDIGRPEVRERALQSLRDFLNRARRPQFVFLDNLDMLIGPDRFAPPNYPTNAAWIQAVIGWFNHVGAPIKNEFGTTFLPNVAWAPGFWLRGIAGHPDAPGTPTLPYMGGFFFEHAFMRAKNDGTYSLPNYGTATGVESPANWNRRLLRDIIRLATEYPDKVVILVPTVWTNNLNPNSEDYSPRRLRYAVAGCLILQHNNTYVHIDPRFEQEQYRDGYYPPELFVPLGRWTENYRILEGDLISGGLFVRNYENGIVVWNPMPNRTFYFTVPQDLYDWDRNLVRAGTRVEIRPRTGHVFYSAPEITLEMSPQNAQVLPGQTVQFTVTYRNRGTAPGTNVRIAVPLPQGMTLVGSNPQARLENGQVVWTVPNVPVGGQGTLQFTVRVE